MKYENGNCVSEIKYLIFHGKDDYSMGDAGFGVYSDKHFSADVENQM